jgi:drug/metabolite transporter (DMT)-like permease
VFIWGFTAVLGALISVDAIPLVWYRMLLASFFILIFIAYKKRKLFVSKANMIRYGLVGILLAMHWLAFFGAIKMSNVSITLAMMSTGAFFGSLLEPIFFRRRIIYYEVLFGIIVVIGLYLIFKVEGHYLTGILLALLSAFLGALFSVFNGKLIMKGDASVISFYELFAGMLCITIYLFANGSFDASFFKLSTNDWILIVVLASVCTAYAYAASLHVLKWISPYTLMLTTNMEPVYGIILALLILGDKEYMSPQFYLGAGIILVTVIINGIIKNSKRIKIKKF